MKRRREVRRVTTAPLEALPWTEHDIAVHEISEPCWRIDEISFSDAGLRERQARKPKCPFAQVATNPLISSKESPMKIDLFVIPILISSMLLLPAHEIGRAHV